MRTKCHFNTTRQIPTFSISFFRPFWSTIHFNVFSSRIEHTLCQTFCHLIFFASIVVVVLTFKKRVDRISFNIEKKIESRWKIHSVACARMHTQAQAQTGIHIRTLIHTHNFFVILVLMVMNACVTLCVNYLLTERIFFCCFFPSSSANVYSK